MTTFIGMLLVLALGAALAARYGSDSRTGGDPTGRDPAWSATPRREHTVSGDVRRLAARVAAHRRAWEALDRSLRPWEQAEQRPVLEMVRPRDAGVDARTPRRGPSGVADRRAS